MSDWTRSASCGESGCLEVSCGTDAVLIRNTGFPDTPPISFTFVQWPWFLRGVVDEEHSWKWFRDQDDIVFTQEEADSFKLGVLAGEFDLDRLREIDNR